MKILLIAQVFPPRRGGTGRWMWELYSRLDRFDVVVAAGGCEAAAGFDARADLRIERLPLDFASWGLLSPRAAVQYLQGFRRIDRLVTAHHPAQIHCAKALPEGLFGLALRRRRGLPYVCYTHGEELRLAATSRELRLLTRRVLHGAHQVIANSRFTRQLLLDEWGVTAPAVTVLTPGVDTQAFVPAAQDARIRARLGWHDRPVILTVGTLQKRKGQDTLIAALPAIQRAHPEVLYAMAGPGLERGYLEALARQHGVADAVQFRGDTDEAELIDCYQQCDLFALPNRQIGWDVEGFGIVLVEAQSCGKPVIAGRSGGTADTLVTGCTGEFVDEDSPDAVARAVARLLGDRPLAARMGAAARAWAVEQFDWRHLAERAGQLFSSDAAQAGAARIVQIA
jgi:phosphatidyl-myo-inositol dimannoside synthase